MDNKQSIEAVLATLETITVTGTSNMERLVGIRQCLRAVLHDMEKELAAKADDGVELA